MISQEDQNRALDSINSGLDEDNSDGYSPMITDAARQMMAASKPVIQEEDMIPETVENLIKLVVWIIALFFLGWAVRQPG